METLRKDALINDPLAKHFSEPLSEEALTALPSLTPTSGLRNVSYTITRTRFFDDGLVAILNRHSKTPHPLFAELREAVLSTDGDFCQQVVVIGSGFDSRPWRLPISSVRWFEVDFKKLLQDKIRLLRSVNASFSFQNNDHSPFPMQCFSHAFVPANVHKPDCIRDLRRVGLKETVGTVWVLEGLLVHLSPDDVISLLRGMAQVSAPGSLLLVSVVTENEVRNSDSSKVDWKWGCPRNAEGFFLNTGWQTVSLLPWTAVALMYGCRPRNRQALRDPAHFLIALKA